MSSLSNRLKKISKNNIKVQKFIFKMYYLIMKNSKKIKGKQNLIKHSEALLSNVKFDIVGDNNKIFVEKGTKLTNLKIYVRGSGHQLIIKSNCVIKSGCLWFEDTDCEIIIGEGTSIEGAHIAVTEPNSKIELGKKCMLSYDIDIRSGDSHSIIDNQTNKRINYAKNIYIKDHVWIGAHVQILKGVTIGENSIIGIRSLVTKDISNNCIAAGIPAKPLKSNVTWDRERTYE